MQESEPHTGRKGPTSHHRQPAAKRRSTPSTCARNIDLVDGLLRRLWVHMTNRIRRVGRQIEIAVDCERPAWGERSIDPWL